MFSLLLLAAAGPQFDIARPTCPPARLVLKNGQMPGETDGPAMEHAMRACPKMYPNSPCLMYLVKIRPAKYQVVCAAPEDMR
jgi:hypothetical protein